MVWLRIPQSRLYTVFYDWKIVCTQGEARGKVKSSSQRSRRRGDYSYLSKKTRKLFGERTLAKTVAVNAKRDLLRYWEILVDGVVVMTERDCYRAPKLHVKHPLLMLTLTPAKERTNLLAVIFTILFIYFLLFVYFLSPSVRNDENSERFPPTHDPKPVKYYPRLAVPVCLFSLSI